MSAAQAMKRLKELRSTSRADHSQRFFKTGPGEYGEGDLFLGVPVPQTRSVAREFKAATVADISTLLESPWHEARLCGLVILTEQYRKTKDRANKKKLFDFYMKAIKSGQVNNWDLIDVSAPILGEFLIELPDPYPFLARLAGSRSLWQRRLSVLFTFAFIRAGEIDPTLYVAEMLLNDSHDLIHKAVGWSLREVGKRDVAALRNFLQNHCTEMPRTALRYAIEKLPERERKSWLMKGKVG
jgi:3-methyladenine DNA glycosylase AlkD